MRISLLIHLYYFLILTSLFAKNLDNNLDSLAPISSWTANQTDAKIQKILQSNNFYTANELHFLQGINKLTQQKNPYSSLSSLIQDLNKLLDTNLDTNELSLKKITSKHIIKYHINISLYKNITDIYSKYNHEDYFKKYLYTILVYLSQSVPIIDIRAQGIAMHQTINRETRKDRLSDTLPIIESYLDKRNPNIYDIGASTGIETASMLHYLLTHKIQGQAYTPNIIMTDANIYQYVLYDKSNNIKLIYNAKKQIDAIITMDGSILYSDDAFIMLKKLKHKDIYSDFLSHITPESSQNFFHHENNNLFIEKLKMIDPSITHLENNAFTIVQHDASQAFHKKYPKADVIRIMNLLQYFDKFTKEIIIANLINQLNNQGIIVLTNNATLEDSKFLFVLQKEDNGNISIYSHPITKIDGKIKISLKNIDVEKFEKRLSFHRMLQLFIYNTEFYDINNIVVQIKRTQTAA